MASTRTTAFQAARAGDVERLRALKAEEPPPRENKGLAGLPPDAFNPADADEKRLTHIAAEAGQCATLRWLLTQAGFDKEARDFNGRTPAHVASAKGHVDCLEFLVGELQADTEAADEWHERTPAHYAAFSGQAAAAAYLARRGGADMSAADKEGSLPSHVAAMKLATEVLRVLVEVQADVTSLNGSGWGPIHIAAREGGESCIKLLVEEAGVGVGTPDARGWTPLHHAMATGQIYCTKALKELGADPER